MHHYLVDLLGVGQVLLACFIEAFIQSQELNKTVQLCVTQDYLLTKHRHCQFLLHYVFVSNLESLYYVIKMLKVNQKVLLEAGSCYLTKYFPR